MKVGNHADKHAAVTTVTGSPNPSQDAAKTQAAPTTAIPTTADPSAKIELSSAASTLLDKQSTADFDAEKVARVSQAIDNGTFKINPEVIADKLISNATELLSKHST